MQYACSFELIIARPVFGCFPLESREIDMSQSICPCPIDSLRMPGARSLGRIFDFLSIINVCILIPPISLAAIVLACYTPYCFCQLLSIVY